jgi:hypothetical protein
LRELFVSHHRKKWKGRAPDATADVVFERALLGDQRSSGKEFNAREDRKTLQLCQQVRRALMLALAGECSDDVLREVYVDSVEPMGNGSQLLVRVSIPTTVGLRPWEVIGRLDDRSARLRAIIAQSICRKRVPGLSFVPVPHMPETPAGGAS